MAKPPTAPTGRALHVSFTRGDMAFLISTDRTEVAKELCDSTVKLGTLGAVCGITAISRIGPIPSFGTIGLLYIYPRVKPIINDLLIKTFGGDKREGQEVRDIKPGSLHVLLRCFTEARFLEVLEDYESGKIKNAWRENS